MRDKLKNINIKVVLSIILILIIIFGVFYIIFYNSKKHEYKHMNYDGFDTITEITAYCNNKKDSEKLFKIIDEKIKYYNNQYDIYHDYEDINNIKTINDNAGIKPVKVSKDIIDLLKFSKDMSHKTGGMVNIALGPVLKIWHDKREYGIDNPNDASLPNIDDLKKADKYTDIDKIQIDEDNSTVYIEKNMRIDVGATAKGYACEKIADYLIENNYNNILLSFGGNIRVIGNKIDKNTGKEKPFIIGVRDPSIEDEQVPIVKLAMNKGCLVTSGAYERYYIVDGKRYHHIIDPNTLFPGGDEINSVSIYTNDSGVGDALSTAVYNMSIDEGLEFINSQPDTYAMWVKKDGSIVYSNGFKDMMLE